MRTSVGYGDECCPATPQPPSPAASTQAAWPDDSDERFGDSRSVAAHEALEFCQHRHDEGLDPLPLRRFTPPAGDDAERTGVIPGGAQRREGEPAFWVSGPPDPIGSLLCGGFERADCKMASAAALAGMASLAADPARAAMLLALLSGQSLTATELARAACITAQTASGHLKRLTEAGLVVMTAHGRHRYHRLAGPQAAQVIERLMAAASLSANARPKRTGPQDAALRAARICYDHLAGALGVALADALRASGSIQLDEDAAMLTDDGRDWLERIGIDTSGLAPASRRILCRPCLDWSERRPHLAGRLGAALCSHCFAHGWVRRSQGRSLMITPEGARQFRSSFGLNWPLPLAHG